MLVSRRRVLKAGALAAASVCLPLPGVGALLTGTAQAKPGPVRAPVPAGGGDVFSSSANFRRHLGTPFRLTAGGRSTDVVLRQVIDAPAPAGSAPCFSLLFDTRAAARPASATYAVRHASLGSFQMFVAPVGTGALCEAVVNRRLA